MNQPNKLLFWMSLLLVMTACGRSPEDARKEPGGSPEEARREPGGSPEEARRELAQMNIPYDETSFLERVKENDLIAVELFLDAGMSPNVMNAQGITALMFAAENGGAETVEFLIDSDADVNARNEKGATALIVAALKGRAETVKALINAGADVNVKTRENSMTALMIAEAMDHAEIAEILKQAEAKE
jgi:ankyrin repeat protein